MPIRGPRSVADRAEHALSGVHPTIDGGLILERECLYENWRFDALAENGDPEGLTLRMPENPEGTHLYLSEPNGAQDTMSRQTTAPIAIGEASYTFDAPHVHGSLPERDERFTARIPAPGRLAPKLVEAGAQGLAPGEYWLRYTIARKVGSTLYHTLPSPAIKVVVDAAGRIIRVSVPDVGLRQVFVCFWLSPAGGTAAQARLQQSAWIDRVGNRPEHVRLGAWVRGRELPTRNETVIVRPATPLVAEKASAYDRKNGYYQFAVTLLTPFGESPVGELTAQTDVGNYNREKSRFAITLRPGVTPLATHYRVWVLKGNNTWYVNYPRTSSPEHRWSRDAEVSVWGHEGGQEPRPEAAVLASAEPPRENTSGIPNPTAELDTPTVMGAAQLESATYWLGATYTARGRETPLGRLTRITVPAGQTIRVPPRQPLNHLPNAEFTAVDSGGVALDTTVNLPAGITAAFEPGRAVIEADSTVSGNIDVVLSEAVEITDEHGSQREYTVEQEQETNHTAGTLATVLRELSATGALVRETVLASQSAAGQISVQRTFAPSGGALPGDITWHASTVHAQVVVRLSGSQKSLRAAIKNRSLTPGRAAGRRREKPPAGHTNPSPPPATPKPPGSDKGVEEPPPPPDPPALVPVPAPDRPPYPLVIRQSEDFESGTLGAWSALREPADATTELSVSGSAAITGSYGVRASVSSGGELHRAAIEHTLAEPEAHLGCRARLRIATMPDAGRAGVAEVVDAEGGALGALELSASGELFAVAGESEKLVARNLAAGSVIDAEVSATGAGHGSGVLAFRLSAPGQAMGTYARLTKGDLSGRLIHAARLGVVSLSGGATAAAVDIDDITLSERGHEAYREHDALGRPLYQVHLQYHPEQTPRSDLGPAGLRLPLVPGRTYSAGVFARMRDVGRETPARPLVLVARGPAGDEPLRCLVGDAGVSGDRSWQEYTYTFEAPEDCYELYVDSQDIGGGEFVFQEFALSPGSVVRRSDAAAPEGWFRATYETREPKTPYAPMAGRWRSILGVPPGSPSPEYLYRSGPARSGPWSAWSADPGAVAQDVVLQAEADLTDASHAVPSGYPRLEYRIMLDTLLYEDRRELPGGTLLSATEDYTTRRPAVVAESAAGNIFHLPAVGEAGHLPPFRILCRTAEARRVLEEEWDRRVWCIETLTEVLWVRLSERPEFERVGNTRMLWEGALIGFYEAEVGRAEVLDARPWDAPPEESA